MSMLPGFSLPGDLICVSQEGEKAADAAAELMPDHVATRWPNGSNSWHKADLTPLNGRAVALWPDSDACGRTCMEAIELKVAELGAASVQRISLDVFKLKPNSKGGKPTKWNSTKNALASRPGCSSSASAIRKTWQRLDKLKRTQPPPMLWR